MFGSAIMDKMPKAVAKGVSALASIDTIKSIYEWYKSNPFNEAYDNATTAG